jgi:hypothetical protein
MIDLTPAEGSSRIQPIIVDEAIDQQTVDFGLLHVIDNFMLGYKKHIVSNKKARIIMKIMEGKSPLAFK